MRARALLAALLAAASCESAAAAFSPSDVNCTSLGGLRTWLCLFEFSLPDISLDTSGFTAHINGLRCDHLQVKTITSSDAFPPTVPKPQLSLGMSDVSLNCTVDKFDFRQDAWPHLAGNGHATFDVEQLDFSTDLVVTMKDGLADSVALKNDKMSVGKVDLHLKGSIWVAIVSAFEGLIEKAIAKALPKDILPVLEGIVANNVTALLRELDGWVEPYLKPPPTLPEPNATQPDLVDWRTSSALGLVDFVVDDLVGAPGVDALVRLITPKHPGTLALSPFLAKLLLHPINVSLGALGNISVSILGANVTGLDSLTDLELLEPLPAAAEAHSLKLAAAANGSVLSANISLLVTPNASGSFIHAPPLVENFTVQVALADLSAEALAYLALDEAALDRLTAADLKEPLCFLRPLLDPLLRALHLKVSLDELSVLASGGALEADIDKLIDDSLRLVTQSFAPVIPDAINGLVGGPIRGALSDAIAKLIDGLRPPPGPGTCDAPPPPVPPPSRDAFDWSSSTLVELVDIGTTLFGAKGFDALAKLLTGGTGNATLGNVTLSGLESVSKLVLMQPQQGDKAALRTALQMGELGVGLVLSLGKGGAPLVVNVSLADLDLGLTARLGLNASGLRALQLRQLVNVTRDPFGLNASGLIGCPARQVITPDVLVKEVDLGATIAALQLRGAIFGVPVDAALDHPLALALPGWLMQIVTSLVSDWLQKELKAVEANHTCPAPSYPGRHIDDLRDDNVVRTLDFLLNSILGDVDGTNILKGKYSIDALVDALSAALGLPAGELRYKGSLLEYRAKQGAIGTLGLKLSNVTLTGLDSVFEMDVADPCKKGFSKHGPACAGTDKKHGLDGRTLNHTVGVGGHAPMRAALRLGLLMGDSGPHDWHDFELAIESRNTSLDLSTPLQLDTNALGSLSLGQLMDGHSCLAEPLRQLSIDPAVSGLSVHGGRAGGLRVELRKAGAAPSEPGAQQELLGLLTLLMPGLEALLDNKIDVGLQQKHAACEGVPYVPPPSPPRKGTDNTVPAVIAGLMIALPFLALGAYGVDAWRRRHKKAEKQKLINSGGLAPLDASLLAPTVPAPGLNRSPRTRRVADDAPTGASLDGSAPPPPSREALPPLVERHGGESFKSDGEPQSDDEEDAWVRHSTMVDEDDERMPAWQKAKSFGAATSLSQQPMYRQKLWVQVLVPLVICVNIAGFTPMLGATVDVIIKLAGDQLPPLRQVSQFTLVDTITDSWNAGVYPLSVLILVMSCIWPYSKLVLMLFAWWAPAKWLPPRRCERMLRAFDALGKWSFLDFYMLMMLGVAFHLNIKVPSADPHDPDLALVDVFVSPAIGIKCFLSSVILSLILAHTLLAMHRAAAEAAAVAANDPAALLRREERLAEASLALDTPRFAVRSYQFRRPACLGGHRRPLHWVTQLGMLLMIGTSGLMIMVAATTDTFSLQIGGLAGALLTEHDKDQTWSVASLGQFIPQMSDLASPFTLRIFQVVYFATALAVPLWWLLLLAVLWCVPLRPKSQRRLFLAAEVAHAWSALDIFIITLIAALLELDQYVQFIVGSKCDGIEDLAKEYFSDLLHGSSNCFDVKATLLSGCWYLFAASVVSAATGMTLMYAGKDALSDHERRIGRRLTK